jgi:hypothetical protein
MERYPPQRLLKQAPQFRRASSASTLFGFEVSFQAFADQAAHDSVGVAVALSQLS